MSRDPVASDATACCTASATSAAFIPASWGARCVHSKRSGKYTACVAGCAVRLTPVAIAAARPANSSSRRVMLGPLMNIDC